MFNEILTYKTIQQAFQSIIKASDSFKACEDIEFRKPTDLQTTIQHCPPLMIYGKSYPTFHTKVDICHDSPHHPIAQAGLNSCSWHSFDFYHHLVALSTNLKTHLFRRKTSTNILLYQCPYSQFNTELDNKINA